MASDFEEATQMRARTAGRPGRGISVCGVGAVSGYGWGAKHLWDGVISGESAVTEVPSELGFSEVLGHDPVYLAVIEDPGPREDGLSRFSTALMTVVDEAVENALERGWRPGPTVGLVHAIVLGEVERWKEFYTERDQRFSRYEYLQLMPSTALSLTMQRHDFHGPCMNVSAMCASGNAGLITAKMWLDAGVASDVIVVATDVSGTPANVKHFRNLGVLIPDAPALETCRPFQEGSRGFPGGEAAVSFVLSSRPNGAYLRVLGGAMTHDGFHVTSVNPDHRQIRRCFERALADAKVFPSEVAYLNAHGPGTVQCDAAESEMLDTILTDAEVFSVKPLTGHCQGAASAVELAATCLGYDRGIVPAPPQVAPGHERLLDGPTLRRPGLTVKSSIGLGGHNSAVVLADA